MQDPDFFALQLISGQLVFTYNLGSGRAVIKSNGTYNDALAHMVRIITVFLCLTTNHVKVEIRRSVRNGQLIIDGGVEMVSGASLGTFSALNIYSGYLFVGGVPEELNVLLLQEEVSKFISDHIVTIIFKLISGSNSCVRVSYFSLH